MAFQARHRWVIQRLQLGLGFLDEAQVEELMKTNRIMDKLAHFFRADGPSTVFFYYQVRSDLDSSSSSSANNSSGGGEAADRRKELFIADGLDDAFRGRALFFAKVPPSESPLDSDDLSSNSNSSSSSSPSLLSDSGDGVGPETDAQRSSTTALGPATYSNGGEIDPAVANDHRLTFGVLDASVLLSLETTLSQLYAPLVLTADRDDDPNGEWGQVDTDARTEFLHGLKLFVTDVQENLKAMSTGLDLRKPDKRYDPADTRSLPRLSADDNAVLHFVELMKEWCKQTEAYLEDNDQARWESHEAGPDTELEYWKRRLQRLMGITEQLKTKECKMVTGVLNVVSKLQQSDNSTTADRLGVALLLRQWKQIDTNITEASNEAKDNVKYLATLERFIEPLYSGTPATVIDALPALMNAVKMVHTIARYYNTTERMTKLFMKITNQMISLCKYSIVPRGAPAEAIWTQDPDELLQALEACLKLNEAYQEQYRLTKDKLLTMPKGKQFDFSETQIFGKFDLFCRRVVKLIDMFSTIHQFRALAQHALEGMDTLLASFNTIIGEFRASNKHDLLDYHNNKFDRDYVEFNIQIADLEASLQQFINVSFDSITSIEQSLLLLKQFQSILQRESLRSDLDSKFTVIFHNYGLDLTNVQDLYEKCRHDPPVARNLPPVAGNILWSRHLLRRIEEPMRKFENNPTVLSTKDSKKIIKTYNKVARTLVAFEYLWYEAWCRSVETAKAGLHATLIIRHPDTSKLYVNFDKAILQLIREARCLDRMGIEVPENARMVMLQEDKFKMYYNDLTYTLKEYDRVLSKIVPVAEKLLVPHLEDLQLRLRPGLVTLTWTSMNIDAYTTQVHAGLQRLEELINNVLDAIENRIDKNLKVVARASLVHLPTDQSFALDDFVRLQEKHVASVTLLLGAKNVEIENAVEDVLRLLCDYTIDGSGSAASSAAASTTAASATASSSAQQQQVAPRRTVACDAEAMHAFRVYYRNLFYRALLNCTKASLDAIKKRVCSKAGTGFLFLERPFFEVDVQLSVPSVRLSPSLDDIQRAINRSAVAVLKCSKSLYEWGQQHILPESARTTLFEKLGCDTEIIKVAILLTGALHGTKNHVHEYLATFKKYDWLWKEDMEFRYSQFMKRNPLIQDFEHELRHFMAVEAEILHVAPVHNIAVLSLNTKNLKLQLRNECRQWKVQYSDRVHSQARAALAALTEYIRVTTLKLSAPVESLDALRFVMGVLREVRERESAIEMEIAPILDMYDMLEHFLPGGYMDKDEMDQKSVIRSSWRRLVDYAEEVTDNLSEVQGSFKKQLVKDVREFQADVAQFRADYTANGPMVSGISPAEAVARLKRFKDLLATRERKLEVYSAGEELFGMRATEYPELVRTKKELALLDQLYGLYMDVAAALTEFQALPWTQVGASVQRMSDTFSAFDARCKKLPKKLCEWEAYHILRKDISDFVDVLPLVRELSREAIKARHWEELVRVCSAGVATCSLAAYDGDTFAFRDVLNARLLVFKDDVEYISESAQKQLQIETKIRDIKERWAGTVFEFGEWRARGVPVLKGYGQVIEDLEESQLQLQAMLSMRHVVFFRDSVQSKLTQLSETADVLERWVKVQTLWMSLESVFTGGDIAKQMPLEAKKFAKIDKDWQKVMVRASELGLVVACCANELLRSTLPMLFSELEKCQKSLEGYLEQKRRKFPRFYFVSNPLLLLILSRGCSDPMAVQQYYEKIFDSVDEVVHDSADKRRIVQLKSRIGSGSSGTAAAKNDDEVITLATGVVADGNIEDWLRALEREMRATLKGICRQAAAESSTGMASVRDFVTRFCAQFALLGIQLSWTAECQEALQRCRTTKGVMSQTSKRHGTMLSELSSWCLTDLGSKLARTKVETLITIQVHQRDVFLELCRLFKEKKLSDANDFEWLKQARFYWKPANSANGACDLVGPDACVISICDIDFKYAFEYLGCKERLVITPLTDRAYITLSQALGMHLGGAPAGPAGTGKTETVKDLGRSLGVFVIVTNCTDQQRFSDMAKIFKGLCQGGLWGCFDEFNRIELPVLSVVAQQVLAITNARRLSAPTFSFPGDPAPIALHPDVGYFITMNPGYQGRQELPENLKALFRGVAMMVPDREIIIKVRLCAVGYDSFAELARKFKTLYVVCEEQLSKQRHYDFGLRNILSVLRTAGATKRANLLANEEVLLMTTLRDMNLSKLVAPDIPIFLSMLRDIFPGVVDSGGSSNKHGDMMRAISDTLAKTFRVARPTWTAKVLQLFETLLVRHGIMLVGPAGAGKSEICRTLQASLSAHTKTPHRQVRMNPKAIRAEEMFGETDKLSGEWVDGVFAAMWAKFNDRSRKDVAWIVCDGPVDAVWIENLNTVLDDNKILTLANGDRLPMTDNCKLLFEVEDLRNASPATVSRAGIIYVSDTDLDWEPVVQGWLLARPEHHREPIARCVRALVGTCEGPSSSGASDGGVGGDSIGHLFEFIARQCRPVVFSPRVALMQSCLNLLQSLLACCELSDSPADLELELARMFVFSLAWAIGGVLDLEDRRKLHEYLSAKAAEALTNGNGTTATWLPTSDVPTQQSNHGSSMVFDHFLHHSTLEWEKWSLDAAHGHSTGDGGSHLSSLVSVQAMVKADSVNMAHVIVPTTDTARALYLVERLHSHHHPVLLVGETGTGKSTLARLFFSSFQGGGSDDMLSKTIIFSGSSSPGGFQATIEGELDKRGGKTFGPANGKKLTFFLDDLTLPARNGWGDQPTLEVARQLVETGTLCFLDKDKRGDLKALEDLRFIAAMRHAPRGNNNNCHAPGSSGPSARVHDIPNRLKRHFMVLNVLPPSPDVVETIYGQLVRWRFADLFESVGATATTAVATTTAANGGAAAQPPPPSRKGVADVAGKLAAASVMLWDWMRRTMLPTPQKFHYVFSMRELSRCFQGILRAPIETLTTDRALVRLWRHESERVFADRLVTLEDKRRFLDELTVVADSALLKPPPPVKERGGGGGGSSGGGDHHHGHHLDTTGPHAATVLFVDFLRDAEVDEYGEVVNEAPRYYEPAPSAADLRARVEHILTQHQRSLKDGGSSSSGASGSSGSSSAGGRTATTPSLILFDEALSHLVRIARVLGIPQSNMMLVGVGGSGKQSLARLASMLAGHQVFQIAAIKGYNVAAFLDDLRALFKTAGQAGRGVTFLLTEAEIKDDAFLEHVNSLLAGSGELPGLFPRDELAAMAGELRSVMHKDKTGSTTGGGGDYSLEHLVRFFFDRARANLHVVLCLSPVSARFAPLCREYPHLVAGCTIDWFLPWPEDALAAVSRAYLTDLPLVTASTATSSDPVKEVLVAQMARIHLSVEALSDEYFAQRRRRVFQTPRSFLSFLATYRALYNDKLQEIARSESAINIGLQKLTQGAQDVESMKRVLKEEEAKLATAEAAATKMLENLQIKSLEAKKESDLVERIKEQCLAEATEIGREKSAAEEDLARAQPFLDEAERAVSSIKPNDLNELKKLAKPGDIIKLIFDCVAVLQMAPLLKVERTQITLSVVGTAGSKDKRSQVAHDFILDSFQVVRSGMLADTRFLQNVFHFSKHEKDRINDETVELMQPYLELEGFSAPAARNASRAAEGLFCWVQAMTRYHEASKVVKPKLEALRIAEGKFEAAQASLAASEQKLAQCQGVLTRLQDAFQTQMEDKARVEAYAAATRKKMEQATSLIGGLGGERARWTEDSNRFVERKLHLAGDCAVAAAFLSYAGAFNHEFRTRLVQQRVPQELSKRGVPLSPAFVLEQFLVDVATLSDWSLQGLPTDPLSIQNGILVARATGGSGSDSSSSTAPNPSSSSATNGEGPPSMTAPPAVSPLPTQTPTRYPLLIDPQGQAIAWVLRREAERLPTFGIVPSTSPKLRDHVEFCVSEGKALIVDGVDGAMGSQAGGDGVDPLIHSLLDRDVVVRAKTAFVRMLDRLVELHEDFRLYLATRLPAPVFSPELQARALVVDFTVTQHGLEEQLLAQVIQKEQRSLEEQLQRVQNELSTNTKALVALDALLLERLSANDAGNLLDDAELVTVLAHTKVKAKEVNDKIAAAEDMKRGIDGKREAYRPVATRGAALYFALVDLAAVNVMYQASLDQFLVLFRRAIDVSERASLASKRVANILETLTYTVYRYVNRGLYERHKLGFLLMAALKMLAAADTVTPNDVSLLLKAGAARKLSADQPKPFAWLPTQAWLNVVQLATDKPLFRALLADMERGEAAWRRWYEHNEPERQPVPEYEPAVFGNPSTTTASLLFHKLLLVRALREDRTLLAALEFVKAFEVIEVTVSTNSTSTTGVVMRLPALGPKYTEPVTDTVEGLFADLAPEVPALFLLSAGADPTEAVELLARRKRQSVACISMGEGQETVAARAVALAMLNGSWVLLQNCHLGLGYLDALEETLARISSGSTASTNASASGSGNTGGTGGSNTASTGSTAGANAASAAPASASTPANCSPEFRLFLTAEPHEAFPIVLLHRCTRATNEPPAGLRAGLLRSFTVLVDQDKLERVESQAWRALLFALCFLHSVVQERRKFGALGFAVPYEFDAGDLGASLSFLERHLYAVGPAGSSSTSLSWTTIQYMVAEVHYGGRITDEMDRRLFRAYCEAWLNPTLLGGSFAFFSPDASVLNASSGSTGGSGSMTASYGSGSTGSGSNSSSFHYGVPDATDIEEIQRVLASFPKIDSPEVFGLHPNADLTFRNKEAAALLAMIAETQPKDQQQQQSQPSQQQSQRITITTPVETREEVALRRATELLAALPADFGDAECVQAVRTKLGGPALPLNICLLQEAQRLQLVLEIVRSSLEHAQRLLVGEASDSDASSSSSSSSSSPSSVRDVLDALVDGHVPRAWRYRENSSDEISWRASTLGQWVAGLTDRAVQLRSWLERGRPTSFWLAGFMNPQGFLTAVAQEVARHHASERWALDDVVLHAEVTDYERPEQVKNAPRDGGVLVHGLVIDGAAWSRAESSLVEAEPKKLFASLPVVYVTATTRAQKKTRAGGDYGPYGGYEAPCYQYAVRTDRFYVFSVVLASRDHRPLHWTLRGVALLCSADR